MDELDDIMFDDGWGDEPQVVETVYVDEDFPEDDEDDLSWQEAANYVDDNLDDDDDFEFPDDDDWGL